MPGVPDYTLDPHIVLPLILPPLLYTAAVDSSYLDLRANMRPVALLSVGYVLFATLAVGYVAYLLVPDLPLTAALVLGAVVAPPDAVAATAIARKLGLPHRITTILQGESLVNDATAITAFKVALAAAVGEGASWGGGIGEFALASVGGVGVGLVLMVPLHWLRTHLHEALLQNTLSLLIPFVAYAAAEQVGASGVLAVVVVALYLGHRSWQVDFATRLQEDAVWKMVAFVLESAVFALIGLQLPFVLRGLGEYGVGEALLVRGRGLPGRGRGPVRLGVSGDLPAAHALPRGSGSASPTRTGGRRSSSAGPGCGAWSRWPSPSRSRRTMHDGEPFPGRNLVLFLTFTTVIGTLVVQGLTLPPLIRLLKVPGRDRRAETLAEAQAQSEASGAAERRLDELLADERNALPEPLAERLRAVLERRRNAVWERLGAVNAVTGESADDTYRRLSREMIEAEREVFVELRDRPQDRRRDDADAAAPAGPGGGGGLPGERLGLTGSVPGGFGAAGDDGGHAGAGREGALRGQRRQPVQHLGDIEPFDGQAVALLEVLGEGVESGGDAARIRRSGSGRQGSSRPRGRRRRRVGARASPGRRTPPLRTGKPRARWSRPSPAASPARVPPVPQATATTSAAPRSSWPSSAQPCAARALLPPSGSDVNGIPLKARVRAAPRRGPSGSVLRR